MKIDEATLANYKTVLDAGKATCQEASQFSVRTYIPCGGPAIAIVDNGDSSPYFMCALCADHNVRNRRAVLVYSKGGKS